MIGITQQESDMPDSVTFEIPAEGNDITKNDIERGQLRITVDYKQHFPSKDTVLHTTVGTTETDTPFRWRDGRSHVWQIGKEAMQKLRMRPGDKVRVTRSASKEYRLAKKA